MACGSCEGGAGPRGPEETLRRACPFLSSLRLGPGSRHGEFPGVGALSGSIRALARPWRACGLRGQAEASLALPAARLTPAGGLRTRGRALARTGARPGGGGAGRSGTWRPRVAGSARAGVEGAVRPRGCPRQAPCPPPARSPVPERSPAEGSRGARSLAFWGVLRPAGSGAPMPGLPGVPRGGATRSHPENDRWFRGSPRVPTLLPDACWESRDSSADVRRCLRSV